MRKQNTISKSVTISGNGVHTGEEATVTLNPAPVGNGITLVKKMGEGLVEFPLVPEAVQTTTMCTQLLGEDGNSIIKTVEHLFAAIQGLQIDNIEITVEGDELPILDGSALPWVNLIDEAGIVSQDAQAEPWVITEPKTVEVEGGLAYALPSDTLEIGVETSFPVEGMEVMQDHLIITPEVFREMIAPARTFCLMKDVERLRDAGLIKGGSLECAVVFNDDGKPENPEGLRFPDEPLRHKILDVMGDLLMAGRIAQGSFHISMPGHGTNNLFLNALFE